MKARVWGSRSCSAALLVLARAAHAGNDDELFVGNQAAMSAGAVSATVTDSSATWYNPAGLGAGDLDQIDVSGTFYTLRSYAAPGFLSETTGERDRASILEFVSTPAQIAYVRRLAPGVGVGFGYFAPQASNLILREALRVNRDGLDSAWQLSFGAVRTQHTGAAGLGFGLSPAVRLGVSAIGTYETEQDSVSLVAAQGESGASDGAQQHLLVTTTLVTALRLGIEIGAGAQIRLTRSLRLALTARSPRMAVYQDVDSSQATAVAGAEREPPIQAEVAEPNKHRAVFSPIRAGRAGIGLAKMSESGGYPALEVDVQPGVRNTGASVERRAVVNARLGVYQPLWDGMAVGGGLFTDRSPDPKPRDVLSAQGDFYGVSAGLEIDHSHRLAADEERAALSFSSTFALRYAFSRGYLNGVRVDPNDLETLNPQRGRLIVHELGFYLGGGVSF